MAENPTMSFDWLSRVPLRFIYRNEQRHVLPRFVRFAENGRWFLVGYDWGSRTDVEFAMQDMVDVMVVPEQPRGQTAHVIENRVDVLPWKSKGYL